MVTILTKLKTNFQQIKMKVNYVRTNTYLESPLVEFIYKDEDIAVHRDQNLVYVKYKKTILKITHHIGEYTNKTINNISRWLDKNFIINPNNQLCRFIHLEGVINDLYITSYQQIRLEYKNDIQLFDIIRRHKEIYISKLLFDHETDFIEQFISQMRGTRDEIVAKREQIARIKKEYQVDPIEIKKKCEHLKDLPIEQRVKLLKSKKHTRRI